jgi:putative membrane protein
MIQAKYFWFPVVLGLLLITAAGTVIAQTPDAVVVVPDGEFSVLNDLARPVLLAVLWTMLGVAMFAASIRLMVALTPFSVRKEIEDDQNTALGIVMGAMILGLSIILAAAIIG